MFLLTILQLHIPKAKSAMNYEDYREIHVKSQDDPCNSTSELKVKDELGFLNEFLDLSDDDLESLCPKNLKDLTYTDLKLCELEESKFLESGDMAISSSDESVVFVPDDSVVFVKREKNMVSRHSDHKVLENSEKIALANSYALMPGNPELFGYQGTELFPPVYLEHSMPDDIGTCDFKDVDSLDGSVITTGQSISSSFFEQLLIEISARFEEEFRHLNDIFGVEFGFSSEKKEFLENFCNCTKKILEKHIFISLETQKLQIANVLEREIVKLSESVDVLLLVEELELEALTKTKIDSENIKKIFKILSTEVFLGHDKNHIFGFVPEIHAFKDNFMRNLEKLNKNDDKKLRKAIVVLKFMEKILAIYSNMDHSRLEHSPSIMILEISLSLRVLFENFCVLIGILHSSDIKMRCLYFFLAEVQRYFGISQSNIYLWQKRIFFYSCCFEYSARGASFEEDESLCLISMQKNIEFMFNFFKLALKTEDFRELFEKIEHYCHRLEDKVRILVSNTKASSFFFSKIEKCFSLAINFILNPCFSANIPYDIQTELHSILPNFALIAKLNNHK